MKIETKCVQAGYNPENGEPRVLPIAMSTTYKYESTQEVGDLFDLKKDGFFYTRIGNPTVDAVERKIAALEGGVGAMMTSSGQAASLISILNIASTGDHVIASIDIYGGTTNLLGVTLKKMGIEVTLMKLDDLQEVEKTIRPNTKAIFGETLANPALTILDIQNLARLAHKHGIPLIVDNTFATPYLCRPFEWGADIVVHSTSKYIDGHAMALGGVIIDSGKFDWEKSGKFDCLTQPDPSYHGLSYTKTFGFSAFIVKARVQLMRDLGSSPSPMNAFLANVGLETLHLRMDRHCDNALKVAKYLEKHPKVKSIVYPGLASDPNHELCRKYMGGKASGVITFELQSYEACVRFMDSLKLACIVVHVADARTGVLHPASSTHRQLTEQQLIDAGISKGTIRFSVGLENVDDIIADIAQALVIA
ncbi:MAG: O-acetylhomoserine aminocarboxypropyltransferase/cysteine synthase [Clostridia bacterium]|nr:O-acetylhomoserine aminocarboxypropyltransferase/cysteine synthase [Clostridia bacterium]